MIPKLLSCDTTSMGSKNGSSLDAQIEKLKSNGAEEIFTDSFTGTKMDRPELKRLLSKLKDGDTLIVTKLDRFARSVSQASELISQLIESGVTINVLGLGVLSNSSVSQLMSNILLAFAQFERDMIFERTQEGKAIARLDPNYREGRNPLYKKKQVSHALEMLKDHSYKEVTELTGISKSTLIRAKRKQEQA